MNLLLEFEQFTIEKYRKKNYHLIDLQEGPLTFHPTYKFDINKEVDEWDTSKKQRTPSW